VSFLFSLLLIQPSGFICGVSNHLLKVPVWETGSGGQKVLGLIRERIQKGTQKTLIRSRFINALQMGGLEGSRMRLTKGSQVIEPYRHGGGCPWRKGNTFMGTGLYFINSSYMESCGEGFGLRWLN
jgi:hypothetical protein